MHPNGRDPARKHMRFMRHVAGFATLRSSLATRHGKVILSFLKPRELPKNTSGTEMPNHSRSIVRKVEMLTAPDDSSAA